MDITVYQLGKIEYRQASEIQRKLSADIAVGEHPPALLLLEHPHVYTLGRQSDPKDLLWDTGALAQQGIQVEESDRGGEITYHGPGQLVGYPILPLGKTGTLEYLRKLEEALIQALAFFGISGERIPGQTGVWIAGNDSPNPPAKIASIGVRVDTNRITRHGFALNVAPDMRFWDGIIACGLENQRQASIAELIPYPPEMNSVKEKVLKAFSNEFNCKLSFGKSPPQHQPIV
jgi:lipoate-protein ligase B